MTIAQQLRVKDFPFEINDANGNLIYWEDSDGFWKKREYDSKGKLIYWENSRGYWEKREHDSKGNRIYYENSHRHWVKREYDPNNNEIYYENSEGYIKDNRPKTVELSMDEIAKKFGIPVSQLKIKK